MVTPLSSLKRSTIVALAARLDCVKQGFHGLYPHFTPQLRVRQQHYLHLDHRLSTSCLPTVFLVILHKYHSEQSRDQPCYGRDYLAGHLPC